MLDKETMIALMAASLIAHPYASNSDIRDAIATAERIWLLTLEAKL